MLVSAGAGGVVFWLLGVSLLLSSSSRPSSARHHHVSIVLFASTSDNFDALYEKRQRRKEYDVAVANLHQQLQRPDLAGPVKHQLHCEHRLRHGRQPNVCRNCWSYDSICICEETSKIHSNNNVSVILWTHHKEWGSPSNTGSVVSLALSNCTMLLKGLERHDAQLNELLLSCQKEENSTMIPVVLWARDDDNDDDEQKQREFVTVEQLLMRDDQQRDLLLIVVEGTWRQARRMVAKLPVAVRGLQLDESQILMLLANNNNDNDAKTSLLHPLRRTHKSDNDSVSSLFKVCTAEAVVSALVALSAITKPQAESILQLVETKVKRTVQYQGKVPRA